MDIISNGLQEQITQPIFKTGKYCCTIKLPAKESYTDLQREAIGILMSISLLVNGRIYVIPFPDQNNPAESWKYDLEDLNQLIVDSFGEFIEVKNIVT